MGYDISKTSNHEDLKFVIYHYDVAHSHAEKAVILNDIIHKREIFSKYNKELNEFTYDYEKLEQVMDEDIKNGLIPLAAFGVFGATSNGSSDDIARLAEICKKRNVTSIVDAAWAGTFTINEEFTHYLKGLEHIDYYMINFSKNGGSGMESSILYLKNRSHLISLAKENQGKSET